MALAFRGLALAAARAACDKKGEEISLLHVGRRSPIADYLLIVTANSKTHLAALEGEVEEAARRMSVACLRRARPTSDRWRVLDFGGLLVHIMTAQTRHFYALDKLYHGAPAVEWSNHARKSRGPARTHARSH